MVEAKTEGRSQPYDTHRSTEDRVFTAGQDELNLSRKCDTWVVPDTFINALPFLFTPEILSILLLLVTFSFDKTSVPDRKGFPGVDLVSVTFLRSG